MIVMPTFMDVHGGFAGATPQELAAAHEADLAFAAEEGVHLERGWLDPASGLVFRLARGPSREAVLRVHERAGHPATEVYELPIDLLQDAPAAIMA
ncbi:SCO4226 family nickel-binding protein [Dactylosporangium darangshiense]|uniref:SCO4226 family nickel-binding protein n=2 Tax=Dactylosporangium darangshiense TaxID=579108 RepID=A0ABP8DBQ6_9ACTN